VQLRNISHPERLGSSTRLNYSLLHAKNCSAKSHSFPVKATFISGHPLKVSTVSVPEATGRPYACIANPNPHDLSVALRIAVQPEAYRKSSSVSASWPPNLVYDCSLAHQPHLHTTHAHMLISKDPLIQAIRTYARIPAMQVAGQCYPCTPSPSQCPSFTVIASHSQLNSPNATNSQSDALTSRICEI
jgi:hypothetical protein